MKTLALVTGFRLEGCSQELELKDQEKLRDQPVTFEPATFVSPDPPRALILESADEDPPELAEWGVEDGRAPDRHRGRGVDGDGLERGIDGEVEGLDGLRHTGTTVSKGSE